MKNKEELTQGFPDIVMRLARQTARGNRQLALVNELLSGYPVTAHEFIVPGSYNVTIKYGEARVGYPSWQGLKTRLLGSGFYFVATSHNSFTMKFSG